MKTATQFVSADTPAWKHGADLREVSPPLLAYEVTQLLLAYCACIDEDRLEQWPSYFIPEGRYEITTRSNADRDLPATAMLCQGTGMMRDRVVSLRHANVFARQYYRHLVTDVLFGEIARDTIAARSNYLVMRTMARDGEAAIFSAGRCIDTLVLTGEGLRFKSRKVIADNDRIHTLLVLPI